MKINNTSTNVSYVLGILESTSGSLKPYTTDELRHRMRWAAALLRGDEKAVEAEIAIARKMAAKYGY